MDTTWIKVGDKFIKFWCVYNKDGKAVPTVPVLVNGKPMVKEV